MSWFNRLWNSARRHDFTTDIDEELQFHIESRTRDNIAAGMTPDQARRDALHRFGHPAAIQEQTRDANLMLAVESTLQDLIVGARSLRKHRTFAATALLTLALGIGVNTAIFTIVRSVLLRPLPFPAPEALYTISYGQPDAPFWLYRGMWDRNFLVLREATTTFEATTMFGRAPVTLTGAGEAARIVRLQVTTEFFRVIGINAAVGRTFVATDDRPGQDRVAVIGDGLWRTRFGADPAIVNRTITLDGIPHVVIGIMPAGFSYPADAAIWTPLPVEAKPNVAFSRPVIGRLKAGVTAAQAQAEIEALKPRFGHDPTEQPEAMVHIKPLQEAIVGGVTTSLLVFSGAVAFVLLIACANVANLLLMRAVARRPEIATRLALGASRGRIVRQLLTESALLSGVGGVLGMASAYLTLPLLLRLIPAGRLPRDIVIGMDLWVLTFAVALSIGTGLIVGLAPALQITRKGPHAALREGTISPRRSQRLRQGLVVAEVALAMMLLVGAGLLVRSYLGLRAIDPGWSGNVMAMTLELPASKYATPIALAGFHDRLLQTLETIPGVTAVGAVNWLPLGDIMISGDLHAEAADKPDHWGMKASVSPNYFRAMGITLSSGRDFNASDTAQSHGVVIVSEAIARRIWRGEDPLGKRLTIESKPQPRDWLTVVGVVADVKQSGLTKDVVPGVYLPYSQVRRPFFLAHMSYLLRTVGPPADVSSAMRSALRGVDPDVAPQVMAPMDDLVIGTIAEPRFQTRLLGAFSFIALVLSALGIYGVLASSVAERQREIGIRVALGAERSMVIGLVLRHTLALTVAGVLLGILGALGVTKALSKLLYNVTPTDPVTFTVAATTLAAVAILAGVIPARRASSIDPMIALRME